MTKPPEWSEQLNIRTASKYHKLLYKTKTLFMRYSLTWRREIIPDCSGTPVWRRIYYFPVLCHKDSILGSFDSINAMVSHLRTAQTSLEDSNLECIIDKLGGLEKLLKRPYTEYDGTDKTPQMTLWNIRPTCKNS